LILIIVISFIKINLNVVCHHWTEIILSVLFAKIITKLGKYNKYKGLSKYNILKCTPLKIIFECYAKVFLFFIGLKEK
jgi:hypothetical protein